jgi:3-deoxy-D-manno-octulosonic-acid transferase
VLASSHEGEEAIALAAHQTVLQEHPNALLLIAPRYPHRGDALAQQFDLQHAQRSKGYLPDVGTSVYLCDTIGEMGLWYRLSSVALIGGSLVPVGGHNPYEALLLGCAVMHGKYVHNFSEVYGDLQPTATVKQIESDSEIAQEVAQSFDGSFRQPLNKPVEGDFILSQPCENLIQAIVEQACRQPSH